MKSPFFTVGIPTFNRQEMLQETLNAVLRQSFTDFELLIYDNASTDGTKEVVARYDDPRLRYYRQSENVGAGRNFSDLAAAARGEFLVINQDDDLLHQDFLLRCHAAVVDRPSAAMYAAPVWREQRGRGYQARLLRTNEGYLHDYLLRDQVIEMDGSRMAVSLLNLTYYFLHPSIAMRCESLRNAGGYATDSDSLPDILTEARVLLQGSLVYDPRPGAMYRDHDANEWKRYGRELRKRLMGGTIQAILAELRKAGVNWEEHLHLEFEGYSAADLEKALHEWAWCSAPKMLCRAAWVEMLRRAGPTASLWRVGMRQARKMGIARFISTCLLR
jgi:glycosyltransferase involved in cell wall biosynthesis